MAIKLLGQKYSEMHSGSKEELTVPVISTPIQVRMSGFAYMPPAGIPGYLWIDASDLTTITRNDSNSVTAIADKSGNGYNMTGTATLLPKYKNFNNILQVSSSQALTTTGMDLQAATITIFSVTRMYNDAAKGRVIQGDNNWLWGFYGGQHARYFFGTWVVSGTTEDTNWHLHSGWIIGNGGASDVWEDKSKLTDTGAASWGPDNIAINAGGYPAEECNCEIAEILIYRNVLDDAERQRVENYLYNKWSL